MSAPTGQGSGGRAVAAFPKPPGDWETRVDALWERSAELPDAELRAAMIALAAELPAGHPVAAFELGGAFDSTGDPATAVGHYRAALAAGLDPDRRRQCVIQLASSLRNLGEASEAVALLVGETELAGDTLRPQLLAFLALALADDGREREAVGVAVGAVARLVDRYSRSLTAYGAELAGDSGEGVR